MSLQEECGMIKQVVENDDITALKVMITDGVDVNGASVKHYFGVSDV